MRPAYNSASLMNLASHKLPTYDVEGMNLVLLDDHVNLEELAAKQPPAAKPKAAPKKAVPKFSHFKSMKQAPHHFAKIKKHIKAHLE